MQALGAPTAFLVPLLLLGTLKRNNSNTAFQLKSPWPKRASLRRQYSKGVTVASGCSRHQWNQVERNEMVLNVGKGDLRGLSHRLPGPSKQDPPLSLGDWRKSRPAPLHTAQGGRKPALGSWSTADPYPHCTQLRLFLEARLKLREGRSQPA